MLSTKPFLLDPANQAFLAGGFSRGRAIFKARLGLLLLAAVLSLCLGITAWAGMEWFRWLMLQGDYSIVSARVLKCRKDTSGDGGPQYYITYQFKAATPTGPATYQREQNVSKTTYARLHAGQPVSVRYHNDLPAISGIADDTTFRDGISVGALMWLPVTLFMGYQLKRCRREIRLGKGGQLLEGRVSDCASVPDPEHGLKVVLDYRFTAPGGRVVRDRETGYREDLTSLPRPDTPVAVLYLDERNYKVL